MFCVHSGDVECTSHSAFSSAPRVAVRSFLSSHFDKARASFVEYQFSPCPALVNVPTDYACIGEFPSVIWLVCIPNQHRNCPICRGSCSRVLCRFAV